MSFLRLNAEPIPRSSQLATLARLLPKQQWDQLRRSVYRQARYRCRACAREGQLHCHEVWGYNPSTGIQWLRGFQALCDLCHQVKHISFVHDSRLREELLKHFMAVNHSSWKEAMFHFKRAQQRQRLLDQRQWTISYGTWNSKMPALRDLKERRRYVSLSR